MQAAVTSCITCMAQIWQESLSSRSRPRTELAGQPRVHGAFSMVLFSNATSNGQSQGRGASGSRNEKGPDHPACTGGLRDPLAAHPHSPLLSLPEDPDHVRLKAKRSPSL